MGQALLIYGDWETCRQKHMKLSREVKASPGHQEISSRLSGWLSGCDKPRHRPQWPKLQGQRAERSRGLSEELPPTPLLQGWADEGELTYLLPEARVAMGYGDAGESVEAGSAWHLVHSEGLGPLWNQARKRKTASWCQRLQ